MKILHIENLSGVPCQISKIMNDRGHESKILQTWRRPEPERRKIQFEHDFEHYYEGSIPNKLKMMRKTIDLSKEFDVIHVHGGLPAKRLDYLYMSKILKKPLVVHYHGSESRMGYGMKYQSCVDAKIVATPDLLQFHPTAHFVPNFFAPVPDHKWHMGKLRVLHIPTGVETKGTDKILKAIEELQRSYDFDFNLVRNVTHDVALEEIDRSNIVIDQMVPKLNGAELSAFGMVSMEAMAYGKAVVSHYTDKIAGYYPDGLPIVKSGPSSADLVEALTPLLEDPMKTRGIAIKSYQYACNQLAPEKFAEAYEKIYQEAIRHKNQ